MAALNTAKIIRRVRQRLNVSQEGLSRLLNATKGAVQHWERGRNNPDLARLMALRQLCPPGAERKDLDALIRQTQSQVAPFGSMGQGPVPVGGPTGPRLKRYVPPFQDKGVLVLKRENTRLQKHVDKLQARLERQHEQLRILEDLATDLQREIARLKAAEVGKVAEAGKPSRPQRPEPPSHE